MSDERTEQPSHKRLKDARDKGQIPRSRDLALAAASVASTVALARLGRRLTDGLADRLSGDLAHFGDAPLRDISAGDLSGMVADGGWLLAVLVGPLAMATMTAGVVMHGFQGGWSFAPGAMRLNWSRLSPAGGIKRFGLKQSGLDTLKTLMTVTTVAWLAWEAIGAMMADSVRLAWLSPGRASVLGWEHAESLLWRVSAGLGLLALGDYALQRYRLMSSLRMTKQEVRDEHRQNEGNAEVKARVRRVQREMSRRRMLNDVPRATVVITNPTHFAIALEYRRESMVAPRVIAKGSDHLALRIRERAREHGVPIVENKPLAQTLFKTAEVGETIPAPLFAAVAEVLAYLVRIKQLML